jgi:ribosomal protein L9
MIPSTLARSCAIAAPKAVTKRSVSSTVRLIALQDLPHGKAYKGDVVNVKPGFARNFLIPKKMAVYATPQNFEKYEIGDPNFETEEELKARFQRESSLSEKDEQFLKESDMLKKYLRTKTVSGIHCVVHIL